RGWLVAEGDADDRKAPGSRGRPGPGGWGRRGRTRGLACRGDLPGDNGGRRGDLATGGPEVQPPRISRMECCGGRAGLLAVACPYCSARCPAARSIGHW